MTFPSVAAVDYSEEAIDTTTHDVLLPGHAAGDLLILFASFDGGRTGTVLSGLPAGWTSVKKIGTATGVGGECFYKIVSGTESNFTYTTNNAERSTNRTWRVTGAHASSAPEAQTTATSGFGTAIGPGALTPSWGAEDTLWVAWAVIDGSRTISVFPTNYTDNQFDDPATGTTSGANVCLCSRNLNAATEDPGDYTISASTDWGVSTLAIRPSGAVVGTTLDPFGMSGFFGG